MDSHDYIRVVKKNLLFKKSHFFTIFTILVIKLNLSLTYKRNLQIVLLNHEYESSFTKNKKLFTFCYDDICIIYITNCIVSISNLLDRVYLYTRFRIQSN